MELTFENLYLAGVEASPKEKINFAARPRLGPLACASGLLRAAGERQRRLGGHAIAVDT